MFQCHDLSGSNPFKEVLPSGVGFLTNYVYCNLLLLTVAWQLRASSVKTTANLSHNRGSTNRPSKLFRIRFPILFYMCLEVCWFSIHFQEIVSALFCLNLNLFYVICGPQQVRRSRALGTNVRF